LLGDYYKEGENRNQALLFPPSIDDYVDQDNNVRAIESYVELLDLGDLGFQDTRKSSRADGQKAYHPKLLLKIYIYGYINKIRSSRALERESRRNIELMWLTQGLTPTYRTISEFRAQNAQGLKSVFKEFVLLCKHIDLIGDGIKAVDGAFLRANASKNRLLSQRTIKEDVIEVEKDIQEYLSQLEYSDRTQCSKQLPINKLPKDLYQLKRKQEKLKESLALLESKHRTQYNPKVQ
jgi:transposase